jgi:hypothetical protein
VDPNAQGSSSAAGGVLLWHTFWLSQSIWGNVVSLSSIPATTTLYASESVCATISRWWRRRTMSSCPRTPNLYWWLMTKGERSVDWKLVALFCICSVCTNPVEPVSRSRWHQFWCVSVSLSISSGKLGGTEFPDPVAPVLAVVCNRPM